MGIPQNQGHAGRIPPTNSSTHRERGNWSVQRLGEHLHHSCKNSESSLRSTTEKSGESVDDWYRGRTCPHPQRPHKMVGSTSHCDKPDNEENLPNEIAESPHEAASSELGESMFGTKHSRM